VDTHLHLVDLLVDLLDTVEVDHQDTVEVDHQDTARQAVHLEALLLLQVKVRLQALTRSFGAGSAQ